MLKSIAFLCAAVVILSCSKKSETSGVLLQSANFYDAPVNGSVVSIIPGGSPVEYIDVMPIPSAPTVFFKVRVDDKEGFIDPAFACFGCTAAAVKTESNLSGVSPEYILKPGTFVAFDSIRDGKSHVYAYLNGTAGWISTSDLSTDAADVEVAAIGNRFESGIHDEDRFTALARAVERYPANPFFQTIKVNLVEAQEQDLADMQNQFGLVFNQKENKVITTPGITRTWIEEYLKDILFITKPYGGDEYESPRYRYYDKYMVALPSFVNLPAKTIGFTWKHESLADHSAAYLLFRLDRSPENITNLWATYKETALSVLESGMVKDVRPYVQNLISVYDHIVAMPNHRAMMQKISKEIAAFDKEHTGSDGYLTTTYTQVEQASIYEPLIEQQKYDGKNDGHAIWYHSFWVRRFSEGNEKAVYDILKEVVNINPAPQAAWVDENNGDDNGDYADGGDYDGEDERGDAEKGDDYYSAVDTYESCTFVEYVFGDCGHLVFTCGDFGDADVSNLPEDEQAVWYNLVVSDSVGEVGNPKYVGGDFYMEVGVTRGRACNDGAGGEGDVAKILAFRLKK
jgi:hypothetical protein